MATKPFRCICLLCFTLLFLAASCGGNAAVRAVLEASEQRYLSELEELVAIPSISALPGNSAHVRQAAEWLVNRLTKAGMKDARIYETQGAQPVVYGAWTQAEGKPTILVYGHYDVQPVDPLEEWQTPPFALTVKGGYAYGRGVDDDKGPLLVAIQAVEALLKASSNDTASQFLPVNVKFLLEGQEEVMSPHLRSFLLQHRQLLSAELCLSADGRQISDRQGAILLGLRGIVSMEVQVATAASDMHSGLMGGSVGNANHVLSQLLSGLRDPVSGRVLVPGFYDGVQEPSEEDQADVAAMSFDGDEEMLRLGLLGHHGEAGFGTLERRWHRPTIEVVGMQGGFTGEGIKTVIPRAAFAKLACRLVPGQEPADVFRKVRSHVLGAAPRFANVSVAQLGGEAAAWSSPRDTPGNRAAARVLHELLGVPPLYRRDGGTIPALTELHSSLGIPTTVFAWGLGENIHAPNERIKLTMLERGREAWAQLLVALGDSNESFAAPAALNSPDLTIKPHDEL